MGNSATGGLSVYEGYETPYQEDLRKRIAGASTCLPASHFSRELPADIVGVSINVEIDSYLLSYSGTKSNAALNAYFSQGMTELGYKSPDFVENVGPLLGGVTSVPNAVGFGAFCIAMILRLCFDATKESRAPKIDDLLRGVFAEEKSTEVGVRMEEYMKRYRMHLNNEQQLIKETEEQEKELSIQLTRLKYSMLSDGQINDLALNRWVNGAAFHAQMLIHLARLKKKTGKTEFENAKTASRSAINSYDHDLNGLIDKFATYKINELYRAGTVIIDEYAQVCCLHNKCCNVQKCDFYLRDTDFTDIMKYVFTGNNKIANLKRYFPYLLKNLDILAAQQGTFQRPVQQ